jgi:hypothetical protein
VELTRPTKTKHSIPRILSSIAAANKQARREPFVTAADVDQGIFCGRRVLHLLEQHLCGIADQGAFRISYIFQRGLAEDLAPATGSTSTLKTESFVARLPIASANREIGLYKIAAAANAAMGQATAFASSTRALSIRSAFPQEQASQVVLWLAQYLLV